MDRKYTKARVENRLSPWVSLVERTVRCGDRDEIFHSLVQADYVSILAITADNRLLLVQQYRPAVDRVTLELPGGLLDHAGEQPLDCAVRELYEETGHRTTTPPDLLGTWWPDTGRLENRFWAFFARSVVPDPDWRPESGVGATSQPLAEVQEMIAHRGFDHALHIAMLGMATMRGLVPEWIGGR